MSLFTYLLHAIASDYIVEDPSRPAGSRERFPQSVSPSLWRTPPLSVDASAPQARDERIAA